MVISQLYLNKIDSKALLHKSVTMETKRNLDHKFRHFQLFRGGSNGLSRFKFVKCTVSEIGDGLIPPPFCERSGSKIPLYRPVSEVVMHNNKMTGP